MKRIFTLTTALALALISQAQKTDSIPTTVKDTFRIGNILIITKKDKNNKPKEVDIYTQEDSTGSGKKIVINSKKDEVVLRKKKARKNITTNLLAWDLGNIFYSDNTNYATATSQGYLRTNGTQAAPTAGDFKLNGTAINFNLWLVLQKVNLIKHVVGVKYGLGLEYYNFRYKTKISFRDDSPKSYVVRDSINFSKNKLLARYVTVPLMLTINPSGSNGFSFSAGVTAGVMFSAKTKQVSGDRGKDKEQGRFGLNPVKLALNADVGYGLVRVFGSYNLTNMFEKGLDFTPYAVGLRISKW